MQQNHASSSTPVQHAAARRSLLWRIHFWSALIASPFILVAALTGVLYIFTPQIESVRYARLDHVAPGGAMRPLDESVAAAKAAASSKWHLQSVLPAYAAGDTVRAVFQEHGAAAGGHEGHQAPANQGAGRPAQVFTVYVNPYTANVVGTLANQDRFGAWSKRLHSRLLQTDGWRWMIELAASAMVAMLLTGVAIWWPSPASRALPQSRARGRIAWKQWHAWLGVALSLVTITMLATGLTWSKYAGEQIRGMRNFAGQAPPRVPGDLASVNPGALAPLTWQAAWDATRRLAPDVAVQMTAPRGERGVWRMAAADPGRPLRRFDLVLDAFDGKPLYYSGWDQQTAFAKATAIGIPFHRGEFGWWNQGLLLLFGAGVLFSLLSGWVMYFKRRKLGVFGLPRVQPGAWKSAAIPLGLITLLLGLLMPVLGVAACALLLMELVLNWRQSRH